jgi:DNA-binding transcriptional ArsR family regulator
MIDHNKQLLFEKQAEVIKAIAHPLRIAIVDFLRDGEQCVCDIAEHIGAERSNVSRHLALMVNVGILSFHKDGLKVIYTLKAVCVLKFFPCVTQVIKERFDRGQQMIRSV